MNKINLFSWGISGEILVSDKIVEELQLFHNWDKEQVLEDIECKVAEGIELNERENTLIYSKYDNYGYKRVDYQIIYDGGSGIIREHGFTTVKIKKK